MEADKTNKKVKALPRMQRAVYKLLCNGRYSASEISIKTLACDPRGHIRELRNKGISVLDEWITSSVGTRYKVYFVKQN